MERQKKTGSGALSVKSVALNSIRGMLIAMIATVAAILVFGLIVKSANPDDGVIAAVNQVIKIVGIALAAFFATRGVRVRPWIYGGAAGLVYVITGYLVFSAIDGQFGSPLQLLSDALLAILVGVICGIIFGQLIGKNKK